MRNPDRWIAAAGGLVSLVTLLSLWFSGVWHLGTRLGAVEARIDGVEQRLEVGLDAVEQRLDGMERHFDRVERRLDGVDARLLSIKEALRGRGAVSTAGEPGEAMALERGSARRPRS